MASFFDQAPLYDNSRSTGSIRDLLLMQGEQKAQAARQAGDNWARTIGGIGNAVAGGVAAYGEHKAEQKQQEQMRMRDAATADAISRFDPANPKDFLGRMVAIRGPKEGTQMAETILKFSQNGKDENPESHLKSTHAALGMFLKESPELQAASWPQFKAGLQPTIAKLGLPVQLPDEYSPEIAQMLTPAHQAIGETIGYKPEQVDAPKPMEVSAGATVIDPVTGKVIFTAPEKPGKVEKSLAERAAEEFALAKARTAGGAAGKPETPEKAAVLKPLSQGEVKGVTEIDSGLADAATLMKDLTGGQGTGTGSELGAMLPNWVTQATGWGADSKKQQATIDRVKQVIGKALEGGVLRKEDEIKYAKILPTIGDAPEVAKAKLEGLTAMLQEKRDITLDNLEATGRDVTKLKGRGASPAPVAAGGPPTVTSDADYAALPAGAFFRTPDGKLKQKRAK